MSGLQKFVVCLISVLMSMVVMCHAMECFQCQGPYDTPDCGLNFNNNVNIQNNNNTVSCNESCLVRTTAFSTVKRGCKPENNTHIGCFFEPQLVNGSTKDVFVCNYACNSDYCNGAGVIPSKKCFSCEGSYEASTCGVNFDNTLMQNGGNTKECNGQCLATTTAFSTVKRGCKPENNTHIGCFFEPQLVNGVTKDVFVCNYACSSDYCNGAGVVPGRSPTGLTDRPRTTSYPARGGSSAHVVTFSSLILIHAAFVLSMII